ncbi:MAG: undecaprenyl/decaprenyl-phosphate alpha-N-acetylglucosaminyl 1-phosphate transferase [Gammaproteobacteria bacterium]|nr:undecaprenyl/decaprenyl-phosphate alpha-N-acetylglucosaminyl 1-phosphate transferase [Gammaproteobacteria bacterium]
MTWFSALAATALLGWWLQRYASELGLLAEPGEHRKHAQATPLVGGLAMMGGYLVASALSSQPAVVHLLPALLLLCVVGVIDDRYNISSTIRFLSQALAVILMIYFTGTLLTSLGLVFGEWGVELRGYSIPLTVFAAIGIINAVNMSDGMDGLAGSLALIVLSAIYFAGGQQTELMAIVAACVAGFLIWNLRVFRSQARLFMGDSGSTMLGLVLAYLLIEMTQGNNAQIPAVTALWFILLPLFDAVGVLMIRPLRGRSPFRADRSHYHHYLQNLGLSSNQSLLIIVLLQSIISVNALIALKVGIAEPIQLAIFLGLFAVYLLFLWRQTGRLGEG